jgi:hypothetical protein
MMSKQFPRLTKALSQLLDAAGVGKPADLNRLTDPELEAIEGIGPARLAEIRKHYPYEADPFGPADEAAAPDAPEVAGLPRVGDLVSYTSRTGEVFDARITQPFAGTDGDMVDLRAFSAGGGQQALARNVPFDPSGPPGTWRHVSG